MLTMPQNDGKRKRTLFASLIRSLILDAHTHTKLITLDLVGWENWAWTPTLIVNTSLRVCGRVYPTTRAERSVLSRVFATVFRSNELKVCSGERCGYLFGIYGGNCRKLSNQPVFKASGQLGQIFLNHSLSLNQTIISYWYYSLV